MNKKSLLNDPRFFLTASIWKVKGHIVLIAFSTHSAVILEWCWMIEITQGKKDKIHLGVCVLSVIQCQSLSGSGGCICKALKALQVPSYYSPIHTHTHTHTHTEHRHTKRWKSSIHTLSHTETQTLFRRESSVCVCVVWSSVVVKLTVFPLWGADNKQGPWWFFLQGERVQHTHTHKHT